MKTYKYILGAVLGCMAAVSCTPDNAFLEEQPKAQLTIANAYNTSDQVVNTLLTGYFEFEELYFPGSMGQGLCYNTFTGTDMVDNKYQLGAAQHVHVQVLHRLSGVCAGIGDDAEAAFRQPFQFSHLRSGPHHA